MNGPPAVVPGNEVGGRDASAVDRIAFVGLHGGVFNVFKRFETELGLRLDYLQDAQFSKQQVDLALYRVVFLQHLHGEDREPFRQMIATARSRNPSLRIVSISGLAERHLPKLARQGILETDPELRAYYGTSPENLKRFLTYVKVKYLKRPGTVLPPVRRDRPSGLYHPDYEGRFEDAGQFLRWARGRGRRVADVPRVVISVHSTHLIFQQPKVVDALIRAFEARGVLAVAMVDYGPTYEQNVRTFKPLAIVHTCHSREPTSFREEIGVPHLHSIFFRKQSIDAWQANLQGLASSELAFHIIGQELRGAIEPQIGAGTSTGGGSSEAFTPIPERIEHLVDRTVAWIHLARTPNLAKKVAFVYYDREMGKAELMRGSATGMFMNGPRSLVHVLQQMRKAGYSMTRVPADEDELVGWMMRRGRQIGIWAPGVLDRLARSGHAVLVPADSYRKWFETRVPEKQREALVRCWGPPPGRFLVWENQGEQFIVIPRIDLGNVILLPQPLRGEAHDTSRAHDRRVPPPHNYLATYFWLQEAFKADAMVHFGTHGTEFLLPGKATGLSRGDWPDIVMGTVPNINPWVINNLGESSPDRRRAYAVLIDHLVPPSVHAGLSDALLNLHNDVDKWFLLEDGALKEKFRASITNQFRAVKLERDLHLDLSDGRLLTPPELERVLAYLHDIHNETTPVSLHVFGEPPRDDLLVPWIVTCLRKPFRDGLGEVIRVPVEETRNPGDRQKYLRKKAEEIVRLVVRQGFGTEEAIRAVGGDALSDGRLEPVRKGIELAIQLKTNFARTDNEVDNLLAALDGKFIPPGPGNSPDRNPAVLPTGRNMVVMNPEEIPTRPSWEIGKQLVDQLLAQQFKTKGRYPGKVAFTLNSFATFQDYGVMESQILYLMGVRPVWDERNLVADLELIPATDLERPRIDVFISALGYYRDMLPTRMRLLDKAVRLVATHKEDDNCVYENSRRVEMELEKRGIAPQKAATLSQARIFGGPPGQFGSAGYYYLVERSGEWDSREELIRTYLGFSRHVYTDGMWGEDAPETYNRQIQGTDVLLRSWSDRTRSPLSNKYTWYKGGSLSLAIQYLTGKEPEWFLSDVRDPDRAAMVRAEDALRKDYRVRLFNRKWIEGMMREGYAGADQVAVHVANTMGWKIMRDNSVSDDIWEEIVDIYIRDKRNLNIREWFEAENPFAYQDLTEILLETIRKGYWQPDASTILEIASEYARSIAQHGEGGGLRGGGNEKLEAFVSRVLQAPDGREPDTLLAHYQSKVRASSTPEPPAPPAASPAAGETKPREEVRGRQLVPTSSEHDKLAAPRTWYVLGIAVAAGCLGLILLGYRFRRGAPRQ
ncbi:MAG: cobaltochelatase subunit CobN [Pirellulales bacterium]